jgi:hypothetical protein
VDSSAANGWAANGRWMLTATRAADGTLVAFVHGENHHFADSECGQWNSTGVLTSQDDEQTWVDHGQIVASPKPATAKFGGMGLSEVVWDAALQRWLGYAGRQPFISTDLYGLRGTWYGYYAGGFTQHIDVKAPTPPMWSAPGPRKGERHLGWPDLQLLSQAVHPDVDTERQHQEDACSLQS